jgi:hypothetical protein
MREIENYTFRHVSYSTLTGPYKRTEKDLPLSQKVHEFTQQFSSSHNREKLTSIKGRTDLELGIRQMFSAQRFPAIYAPFTSDPLGRSNNQMHLQSSVPNPGMYSTYPMVQNQQRFGPPVGQFNSLGHSIQSQAQNQATSVPVEDMIQFLVDDRRRDLTHDNAIFLLMNSIKKNRHCDKVLADLYSGQPIQPEFLIQSILADRLKDVQVSEIIEKVICDRVGNRKTDAGILLLISSREIDFWT